MQPPGVLKPELTFRLDHSGHRYPSSYGRPSFRLVALDLMGTTFLRAFTSYVLVAEAATTDDRRLARGQRSKCEWNIPRAGIWFVCIVPCYLRPGGYLPTTPLTPRG